MAIKRQIFIPTLLLCCVAGTIYSCGADKQNHLSIDIEVEIEESFLKLKVGQEITLSANVTGGGDVPTWSVFKEEKPMPSVLNQIEGYSVIFTATETGLYFVTAKTSRNSARKKEKTIKIYVEECVTDTEQRE